MTGRPWTPDETFTTEDGRTGTRITMKRCCNGCGQRLGDVIARDVDRNGNLTDVRDECPNCRPLVDLEAAGCTTWQLTPRSFSLVAQEIDRLGVFTKGYTRYVDGKLTVIGLRVGEKPGHIVARFGDWLIRHPDGGFTVHKAPEAVAR